jgi:hypothetical protein
MQRAIGRGEPCSLAAESASWWHRSASASLPDSCRHHPRQHSDWARPASPPIPACPRFSRKILMSLSTIVVALNAQLLRRVDLRPKEV